MSESFTRYLQNPALSTESCENLLFPTLEKKILKGPTNIVINSVVLEFVAERAVNSSSACHLSLGGVGFYTV